jgi:hypothetical protein
MTFSLIKGKVTVFYSIRSDLELCQVSKQPSIFLGKDLLCCWQYDLTYKMKDGRNNYAYHPSFYTSNQLDAASGGCDFD